MNLAINSQLVGIFFAAFITVMFFMFLSMRRADKEYKNKKREYKIDSAMGSHTIIMGFRVRQNPYLKCAACGDKYLPTGIKTKGSGPIVETEIWICQKCNGRIFVSLLC